MASLYARKDGRVEIRETIGTSQGPRSRTLAVFRGPLTPDVLERAAARAERPFEAEPLLERAHELGIPITARREDRSARDFLRALRAGAEIDPGLLHTIREVLERSDPAEAPPRWSEAAEWLEASAAERGRALRGLVRTYDRIAQSRPPRRRRRQRRFPSFHSRDSRASKRSRTRKKSR